MAEQRTKHPMDYTDGPEIRAEGNSTADQLKQTAEDAQQAAERVAQQVREYGEKAQDAVRNLKPFMEKSLKDQPMGTLAAVAAVGFLLGALWKK